jgi:hypothetical protein
VKIDHNRLPGQAIVAFAAERAAAPVRQGAR